MKEFLNKMKPKSLVKSYMDHVTVKNPIKTKMITSFIIGALGDYACQRIETKFKNHHIDAKLEEPFIWDQNRTFR